MGCMSSPKWSKLNVENHSTDQPAPTGNRAFRCLHRLMENAEKCDLTSFSGEQLEIEVVTSLGSPTQPLISIFLECRGSSAKIPMFLGCFASYPCQLPQQRSQRRFVECDLASSVMWRVSVSMFSDLIKRCLAVGSPIFRKGRDSFVKEIYALKLLIIYIYNDFPTRFPAIFKIFLGLMSGSPRPSRIRSCYWSELLVLPIGWDPGRDNDSTSPPFGLGWNQLLPPGWKSTAAKLPLLLGQLKLFVSKRFFFHDNATQCDLIPVVAMDEMNQSC